MKIEYVYQSSEQLRNASVLSLQSPAQRVTLELKGVRWMRTVLPDR